MKNALDLNDVSTLSTVLLTNLDEGVFFSKLSKFIQDSLGDKVQIFESFPDESTALRADNGKVVKKLVIRPKGKGLAGYVTRSKRAYYSNSRRDPILANAEIEEDIQGALCMPIMADDAILGTVLVTTDSEERKFSELDINVIDQILEGVSAAVKNMKLYLTAKHLNHELQKKLESDNNTNVKKSNSRIGSSLTNIELLGHSKDFVEVLNMARKVAQEDFPVLIKGFLGTGKKTLARKIHSISDRASSPCVVVHCAAVDEAALELELFGINDQMGVLERANGGTLILDAIDELSTVMQSKILRFLMNGEIYPINSKVSKKINVRLISTTKRNLEELVNENSFREDLFYRINIVGIDMPALSARQEDIKILSEHFLNNGRSQESTKMLTSSAVEKLTQYPWPGNVQELKNLMERTSIVTSERYIDAEHLPIKEVAAEEVVVKEEVQEIFSEMNLHDLEKIHICKTLDHLGGNKTRAAKSLGITVKTLYNKLHSYGLVQSKND